MANDRSWARVEEVTVAAGDPAAGDDGESRRAIVGRKTPRSRGPVSLISQ